MSLADSDGGDGRGEPLTEPCASTRARGGKYGRSEARTQPAETAGACRTSIDVWSSSAIMSKTGPITAAGSMTKTFPSLERAKDRIEERPELSMKVISVMSRHTSPDFWKALSAA